MLPLTAIDFESTGLTPGYPDEPWQIGLVPFELRGGPGPRFDSEAAGDSDAPLDAWLHIAPDRPFNPYAPGRHAEVRPQLAAAAPFPEQWPAISPRIARGQILVAHNASTEKKFLARLAPLTPFPRWIDTLAVARAAFPGLSSYTLADVVTAANLRPALDALLPGRTWHDALFDALACAVFLRWLLFQPGWSAVPLAKLERLVP